MAFIRVSPGDPVRADDINDIQKALDGSAGKAQAISFTELDDAANHALNVRNKDGTNSLIARFRNAANEVVLGIVKEALTTAKQIISTVAEGTAPFVIGSTTWVQNLHADVVDGYHVPFPTAAIADDAVDDTKVGNRVLQLYRRQGGHSDRWDSAGTTDYTPTTVRMQCGCINKTITPGVITNLTFPIAFSHDPVGYVVPCADGGSTAVAVTDVGSSDTLLMWTVARFDGSTSPVTKAFFWLAIGPE